MKEERFEEIRHDYETIRIPKELQQRVATSIETAKKDLEASLTPSTESSLAAFPKTTSDAPINQSGKITTGGSPSFIWKNSWKKHLFHAAGVAAAAMLAITVMANSSETIAHAMEHVPILNSFVRIVTFREYTHSQNDMEANLKVPTVSVEDENGQLLSDTTNQLNDQISAYTNQIIAAYEADVEASGAEGKEAVSLDYEVVTDNDRLFTLRFNQSILMASGTEYAKIYNLDKTTGKLLELKDLFQEGSDYITTISENIKSQMQERMAADSSVSYFYNTETPDTDFSQISGEENFYISETGTLTLVFDEYAVAPGYMGIVEFEIPTETIADIVKEGFVQ